jgi:hypothetical protein
LLTGSLVLRNNFSLFDEGWLVLSHIIRNLGRVWQKALYETSMTSLLLGDRTFTVEVAKRLCGTADFEVVFIFGVDSVFGCFGGRS